MYGIVLSAIRTFGAFVFRSAVIRWAIFFGLYYVVQALSGVVAKLLPDTGAVGTALASLTCEFWYWLDLFGFTKGIPVIVSGAVTRFIVRRLPVVG